MESQQDMLDLQMAAAESLVSCLTSGGSSQIGPRSCFKVYGIHVDNIESLSITKTSWIRSGWKKIQKGLFFRQMYISTCLNHFYFAGNLSYEEREWLERFRPGNSIGPSALMVCWDSKRVMGLMCSSEGGQGKRDGGGNCDQEGNWTSVSWWVWVKRHATLVLGGSVE